MVDIQNRLLQLISGLVLKYAWPIIIGFTLLAVAGYFYTVQNLGVNSDTSEMFDEELSFRQTLETYKQAFPSTEDNLVVVISGDVPELISSVCDSVAKNLRARNDLFESVYQPNGEPFMKQNQLLYLDTMKLNDLSEKLVKARPMMSFLSENYSLKGLFSFLGLMIRFSSAEQLEGMVPMFNKMDTVLMATREGQSEILSWQNLMGNENNRYDARYSFIQVKPVLDYSRIRPAKAAMEEAREIAEKYTSNEVLVRLTGKKAMTYEEMGSVIDGAVQASILALVMVSLVLWLGLRSFRLIAATLYTLIVGLILTAAFSTWAVGQLNMISVAFAVLYIGLGVDYAIHICLRYRELSREGVPVKESLGISIHHIAPALILSTLSTSIGFYAFVPTAFTGVSELGIIAGTGMFISLLVTLLLLPCLIWKLSALGSDNKVYSNTIKGPVIERYRRPIRIASIVLTLAALALLPQITFDYDPINLRDPKSESVSTIRELMANQNFTPWSLNLISSDSIEQTTAQYDLDQLTQVDRVISIYSYVPKMQQAKMDIIGELRGGLNDISNPSFQYDSVPDQEQLKSISDFAALLTSPAYAKHVAAAEFGAHLAHFADSLNQLDQSEVSGPIDMLQRGLLESLPYTVTSLLAGMEPQMVSMNSLPESIKERWISSTGQLRTQVMPAGNLKTNREMKSFAAAVHQVAPEATGDLIVTIASGDTVIKAFKQAIFFAIGAIVLLLLVYLRNIRETLFILVPLMLAGLFTCALTVVLGIDFNFANIIALPLLLGLGVDNGVHIVHRAKTDSSGKGLLQTSTARAVLFSSLTTLFSFGNLAFSPHRGTASMGWLLTIGVVLVLLATLVVLPAFLPENKTSKG